ncbi:MAG: glycosyltransferase family 2 protein [Microcystis panniformis]
MINPNQSPLVSILINNYNYAGFLPAAISSSLEQTYPHLEIIVVDDGSQDRSRQVIEEYGQQIIPIFKVNGGQASAFNQGFAASSGEIICFLDADDLFSLNKVEKVVEIFQDYPDIGWCFHSLQMFTDKTAAADHATPKSVNSGVYDLRNSLSQGKLRGKMPFEGTATSGICFRRSFLKQLLPMPEEIRITSDDYLKYAAFALTPGYILLEKLAQQRIHANNAYTLRKNQKSLRGKINILTAFWLKSNFPQMSKFTNNIFALGYSFYNREDNGDPHLKLLIHKYFCSLTIGEKIEVQIRRIYYCLKSKINPLFQP